METTKENCEISIRQEETPKAEKYPHIVTIKEERENHDAIRITSTVHDAVICEAVTNDMTRNEATNEAPSIYTADRVKESETAKENYEISIQQVGSLQAEQYPQIFTSEAKQEVSSKTTGNPEILAGIKHKTC